ncbi:Uncharacterised protein [Bordetella pertussis]|nr:Uncharacterised protein [Bordetella pertussis]CFP59833.1 Uncharacterised protein [Bordetella pertussis]
MDISSVWPRVVASAISAGGRSSAEAMRSLPAK